MKKILLVILFFCFCLSIKIQGQTKNKGEIKDVIYKETHYYEKRALDDRLVHRTIGKMVCTSEYMYYIQMHIKGYSENDPGLTFYYCEGEETQYNKDWEELNLYYKNPSFSKGKIKNSSYVKPTGISTATPHNSNTGTGNVGDAVELGKAILGNVRNGFDDLPIDDPYVTGKKEAKLNGKLKNSSKTIRIASENNANSKQRNTEKDEDEDDAEKLRKLQAEGKELDKKIKDLFN